MSVVKETLIFCDGKNCPSGCWAESDSRHEKAKLQRKNYVLDGWHFVKGKDYCPDCYAKLKGKPPSQPAESKR